MEKTYAVTGHRLTRFKFKYNEGELSKEVQHLVRSAKAEAFSEPII